MTQNYTISSDGSTVDVWDHTGAKMADGRVVSGDGVADSVGGTFPDEVREALMEHALSEAQAGNTDYAIQLIVDVTSFNVTEGAP